MTYNKYNSMEQDKSNNEENLSGLFSSMQEQVRHYLQLRWELVQLNVKEIVSKLISSLIYWFIVALITLVCSLLLLVGFVLLIYEYTQSLPLAILSALLLSIVALVTVVCTKRYILYKIMNKILKQFLLKKDSSNG